MNPENTLRDDVLHLLNEVNCRIEHGANSNKHLEYVEGCLRQILEANPPKGCVPERRKLTGWVSVYQFEGRPLLDLGNVYPSRENANRVGGFNRDRIACIDLSKYNIEFEVGEGL